MLRRSQQQQASAKRCYIEPSCSRHRGAQTSSYAPRTHPARPQQKYHAHTSMTSTAFVSTSITDKVAQSLPVKMAPEPELTQLITCHLLVPRFTGSQSLMVVGNVRQLGEWRMGAGVMLQPSRTNPHMRSALVRLPLDQRIEAKLMVVPAQGGPWWEDGGENRSWRLSLPDAWEEGAHDVYSNPGGFLIMLHWALPSSATEVRYFPAFPNTAALAHSANLLSAAAAAAAATAAPDTAAATHNTPIAVAAAAAAVTTAAARSTSAAAAAAGAATAARLHATAATTGPAGAAPSAPTLNPPQGSVGVNAIGLTFSSPLMDPLPLCHFTVPHFPATAGGHLVLCGDIPELGSWRPDKGLRLTWRQGHSWSAKVKLHANAVFEAKLAVFSEGRYSFEPGPYRTVNLAGLLRGHYGSLVSQAAAHAVNPAASSSDSNSTAAAAAAAGIAGGAAAAASAVAAAASASTAGAGSAAAASAVTSAGPSAHSMRRTLMSTCVFTCYWGVDETPAVVGPRAPDAEEAPDPRRPSLRQQVQALQAEAKALHADLARLRALFDWARLQRDQAVLERDADRSKLEELRREREEFDARQRKAEATVSELKSALMQARAQALTTAKEHSSEVVTLQQAIEEQRDLWSRQVQQLRQDVEMGELQLQVVRNLLEVKVREEEQRQEEAQEEAVRAVEKERRRLQEAEAVERELHALRAVAVEAERQLAAQGREHEAELQVLQEHQALLTQQYSQQLAEARQYEQQLKQALSQALGQVEGLRRAAEESEAAHGREVARLKAQVASLSLELAGSCAALQEQEEAARQLAARHEEAVRQVTLKHEAELARVVMEVDEVADVLQASLREAEGREARAGEEAVKEVVGREAEGREKERTVREVVSVMQAEVQVEQVQDPRTGQLDERKEAEVNKVKVAQPDEHKAEVNEIEVAQVNEQREALVSELKLTQLDGQDAYAGVYEVKVAQADEKTESPVNELKVAQANEQREAQVDELSVTQVMPLKGKVARKTATGKGDSERLPVGGSGVERGRSKRSKRGVR